MSGLELLRAAILDRPGLIHAFTTRTGGVSEGPYASLNLTMSRGDGPEAVAENRERARAALGAGRLVFANQVHGVTVLRVDAPPAGWSIGEGDALITDRPGLALCAQTADCVPILLYDPERPAIAAIHAGWRGAVAGIVSETLSAMAQAYGTRPETVTAAIGPSIAQANYRVGPEVIAQFAARFGAGAPLFGPRNAEGGARLDVAGACRLDLTAAGVPAGAIETLEHFWLIPAHIRRR